MRKLHAIAKDIAPFVTKETTFICESVFDALSVGSIRAQEAHEFRRYLLSLVSPHSTVTQWLFVNSPEAREWLENNRPDASPVIAKVRAKMLNQYRRRWFKHICAELKREDR